MAYRLEVEEIKLSPEINQTNRAEIFARGPNFVYAKEYILKVHGEAVWNQVIERLPPLDANIWYGSLFTLGTYPFSSFKKMIYTISDELGILNREETQRMYEYIADRSLNSLYKIFFKFSKPEFVISNYPRLWARFFACGEVIVPIAEKGHAIVEFHLPDIFLDWLPPACFGYSKKAVEMAGGQNLRMDLLKKKRSNDELWTIQYDLKWE